MCNWAKPTRDWHVKALTEGVGSSTGLANQVLVKTRSNARIRNHSFVPGQSGISMYTRGWEKGAE